MKSSFEVGFRVQWKVIELGFRINLTNLHVRVMYGS